MSLLAELLELWQAPHASPADKAEAVTAWAALHNIAAAPFEQRFVVDVVHALAQAHTLTDSELRAQRMSEIHRSLMENPQYFPADLRAQLLTEVTPQAQTRLRDDGHLSVDGLRQKTIVYKPSASTPITITHKPITAVEQFVVELNTRTGHEIVLEPDVAAPELHNQTAINRVEPMTDHVVIHFPDNTSTLRDPVLDGLGVWHLFPHRAAWPTITGTVAVKETHVPIKPTHAPVHENIRTVDIMLPGNVPATVTIGKNGLAELKVSGTITLRAEKARQLLLGDPHYPARLPPTKHDQFDQLTHQIALGLWAYDALVATRQVDTAVARVLKSTLVKACHRLAEVASTPVQQLFASHPFKSLSL